MRKPKGNFSDKERWLVAYVEALIKSIEKQAYEKGKNEARYKSSFIVEELVHHLL